MNAVKALAILAAAAWYTPAAYSQDGPVLVVAKKGYYILETGPDGIPTVSPITTRFSRVVILGDPEPSPNPIPAPVALTPRAITARDAALKATSDPKRSETAQKLAMLYEQIAAKITSGELKGVDAISFASRTGAEMLTSGVSAAWQPFRDTLTAQMVKAVQDGANDAEFAKLLGEAASGLAASVPRDVYEALDLKQILQIVKMIIELILKMPVPQPNAAGGSLRQ